MSFLQTPQSPGVKITMKAKFEFTAAEPEEISLKVGDLITLIFKDESGWAKGKNHRDEQKGWFPIDYCEVVEEEVIDQGPKVRSRFV